jgi:hypothetical protein
LLEQEKEASFCSSVAALDATEESNKGKEMAEPVTMGLVEEEREEVEGKEIVVCSLQFCV